MRIPAKVSVHDQPEDVSAREALGHSEDDLIVGRRGRSPLVTLVERHNRYLIVLAITDATSRAVVAALTLKFTALPTTTRRTLTWDRGIEMTRHQEFAATTGVPVYLCNPYSPWQRGTIENTNGLLRQHFPKKTD